MADVIELVLGGALISALIWSARRATAKPRFVLIVAITLLLIVCWGYIIHPAVDTLGPDNAWYNTSPMRELIVFGLMIAGMVARYFHQAIDRRREKIAALKLAGDDSAIPGIDFDFWEFSYPFFVSVITYGALLSQIGDASLTISTTTLSFQFGFFWQTLLSNSSPTSNVA